MHLVPAFALALAAAGLVAAPAPAAAAPLTSSCSLGASTLTVKLAGTGTATLNRDAGGRVLVRGAHACGAYVTSIDRIAVTGDGGGQTLAIDLRGGAFAPGKTKELVAGEISDIELSAALGEGTDRVSVEAGVGGRSFVLGVNGMRLNADPDVDLTAAAVESWTMIGDNTNNILTAAGGGATGGRSLVGVLIRGLNGADKMTGGAGNDVFDPFDSGDDVTGGPGFDTASFIGRSGHFRVRLDGLNNDSRDNFDTFNVRGDVERLVGGLGASTFYAPEAGTTPVRFEGGVGTSTFIGGPAADVLIGGPSADELHGSAGGDVLLGRAGDDRLEGNDGNDRLMGDGGNDRVIGGKGQDRLLGGTGNDIFTAADGFVDEIDGGDQTDTGSFDSFDQRTNVP